MSRRDRANLQGIEAAVLIWLKRSGRGKESSTRDEFFNYPMAHAMIKVTRPDRKCRE